MTTDAQINIANRLLQTKLVSQVFHNCQLLRREDDQTLFPVYQKGSDWVYVGIDDTKGLTAYIRHNGDLSGTPLKLQSCARSYNMVAPLRIVFFKDQDDRNPDELLGMLTGFTFLQGVTLLRIITDKARLAKEESPLQRTHFDGKTFYAAIDVLASFILLPSTCDPQPCQVHPNPLTTCPAAAPQSTSSATS